MRDHMGKLRGNVRTHVGKLQRKATTSSPAAAAPRAHAHQPAAGVMWQPGAAQTPHAQLTPPIGPTQPNISRLAMGGSSSAPAAQHSSALPAFLPRPQEAASASQSLAGPAAQGGAPRQQTAFLSQPASTAGDTCAMAASAQGSGPGRLVQQSSAAAHQHVNSLSQPESAPTCKAQPPGLDLSKLQQILQNVFPSSQGTLPAQPGPASSSAAAAPRPAPLSQVPQPVWNSAAGTGVLQSSGNLLQAATPPLPKVTGKLDHSFGLASPNESAAVLTAVDKAYAQDTATLEPLLDARRNVRPECAGEHLICTEVYAPK